jgi:hypothetical protein
MKFKGDIIITDPCYIMRHKNELTGDDWSACDYGSNMKVLGITHYLTEDTEYGDWSCTTVKDDPESQRLIGQLNVMYFKFFSDYNNPEVYKTEENRQKMYDEYAKEREELIKNSNLVLGHFCADAGLVSVFLLDEILAYNPEYDDHLKHPHCATLIRDFDGDIEITHRVFESKVDPEDAIFEDETETGEEVSVIGKGNINFYTTQTGL